MTQLLHYDMTHVVNTKLVEGLGDLNLCLCIKKCIGELFALAEGTLDDLEVVDVAQEVADGLVWVRPLMWV